MINAVTIATVTNGPNMVVFVHPLRQQISTHKMKGEIKISIWLSKRPALKIYDTDVDENIQSWTKPLGRSGLLTSSLLLSPPPYSMLCKTEWFYWEIVVLPSSIE